MWPYCIAEHSFGALLYLFELCIPAEICNIEITAFGRFKSRSDFALAQDFSCLVKRVECGEMFDVNVRPDLSEFL